jgi:hypothetical protein
MYRKIIKVTETVFKGKRKYYFVTSLKKLENSERK